MKLVGLKLSNFQSFGEEPTEVSLENITFLIGPNGSGKTAILQALARMFAPDQHLRRVVRSDFHVSSTASESQEESRAQSLWIEAEFHFPELLDNKKKHATVPSNFAHMRLEVPGSTPVMRIRLEASLNDDDGVEDKLFYVIEVDA